MSSLSSGPRIGDSPAARTPDASNAVILATQAMGKVLPLPLRIITIVVPMLAGILSAVLILGGCILLIYLLIVLVFYARPVAPLPCRSYDFDATMRNEVYPEIIDAIRTFRDGVQRFAPFVFTQELSLVAPAPNKEQQGRITEAYRAAEAILRDKDDEQLRRMLYLYFTHQLCIRKFDDYPYSSFCKTSMTVHEEFRKDETERDLDMGKMKKFKTDFVDHMQTIQNFVGTPCGKEKKKGERCSNMSERAAQFPQMATNAKWYANERKQAFAWVMSVHKLRLYLHFYHEELCRSAMSRVPDRFSMNLWILFFTPYVRDLFRKMGEAFLSWPEKRVAMLRLWCRGWTALGEWIINMPCRALYASSPSRAKSSCNLPILLPFMNCKTMQ